MNPAIDTSDALVRLAMAVLVQATRDLYAQHHVVRPTPRDHQSALTFLVATEIDDQTARRIISQANLRMASMGQRTVRKRIPGRTGPTRRAGCTGTMRLAVGRSRSRSAMARISMSHSPAHRRVSRQPSPSTRRIKRSRSRRAHDNGGRYDRHRNQHYHHNCRAGDRGGPLGGTERGLGYALVHRGTYRGVGAAGGARRSDNRERTGR